jgi:hypothetical protein
MKTPHQYKSQLEDLGLDQVKIEGITRSDAQSALTRLKDIHTHLKDLETGLNMDMHALRSQYQGRIAALSITTHHKAKVEEEQRAEEERNAKLAPYEEVKSQVQALLVTLEEKRTALEKAASGG